MSAWSQQALADALEANLKPHGETVLTTAWELAGAVLEHLAAADGIGEAAAPAELPLPEGRYARVELPGYRQHTGWVTEETRFGQAMAVVRDWDGAEMAAVAIGPASQVVYLPTPLRRPEPAPAGALPPGLGLGLTEVGGDDGADLYEDGAPF